MENFISRIFSNGLDMANAHMENVLSNNFVFPDIRIVEPTDHQDDYFIAEDTADGKEEPHEHYCLEDTSFDDLAMAVEANSPDIGDTKQFSFESSFASTNGKSRLRWTEEMGKLLLEGVKIYSEYRIGMWKKVAEYVQEHLKDPLRDEMGNIVPSKITNHQCGERYKHHLDPSIKQRKSGVWSTEEIHLLHELVRKYQTVEEGYTKSGRTKSHINWIRISNELNRNYRDCQHKWATVSKATLKAGTFSQEEEDYILRRVLEIGEKEPGLWSLLEGEMGRKARSIQDKYNRLVRKRKYEPEDIPML